MIRSKELNSIGNHGTLKIRKPYTITKQREKWTEEEHQKFLEALKLYGRGWRQIEEHVGTKTAIQIRSHAQKFFSKVVRESRGCTEVIKPIEIPPPRPKRKPMHPYPRKPADTLKGTSVAIQLERSMSLSLVVLEKESQSPSLAVAEKESQSPTSVLNGVTSDAFGSEVSEQHGRCLSLNSCSTDVHSISLSPVVKENENMTLNTGDKGSFLSLQLSPSLVQESQSSLKFDSGSKDTICAEGDAAMGAPFTSFKLFGRTVLATDSQKPSPPCLDKNSNSNSSSYSSERSIGVDNEKIICCNQLNTHSSSEMVDSRLDSLPCGAPASYCMEHQKENSASSDALLPQWILYQGLPFLYRPSFDQTSVQDPIQFEARTGVDIQKEISCTGSNNCSVSEGGNGEKSLDAVDSQHEQPCLEGRGSPRNCRKGFVPYKRCLEERDAKSPMLASEEREGQRARVCS